MKTSHQAVTAIPQREARWRQRHNVGMFLIKPVSVEEKMDGVKIEKFLSETCWDWRVTFLQDNNLWHNYTSAHVD